MLTVVTPADPRLLATLEQAKAELGIEDTDSDAWLTTQLARATAAITNYIGVEPAVDGSRTLGREQVQETFLRSRSGGPLMLSRGPIVSIDSVTEDGTAIDADEYEIATGNMLARLSGDYRTCWTANRTLVTYTAGWVLPGQEGDGQPLPDDISGAALTLIRMAWYSRDRDPTLRSESMDGVGTLAYQVATSTSARASLPADVQAMLDPYRRSLIG